MSSVVISGDTSGTVTVTVPAVAGTNTATLPAATGTVMVSGNMPTFSAYSTTTQNPTSAVATKVILNNKEWDTANAFDSTTNYRFTPQVAGYYQIDAMLRVTAATAILDGWSALYKNGSVYKRAMELGNANTQTNAQIVLSEMVYLNGSTDYIELYGYIQGTSPSFDNSNGQPYNARMAGFLVRTA
jgi:hypothetical protein